MTNADDAIATAKLAERAKQWVSSDEGKQALKKAAREALTLTDRLDKARRVDPEALRKPITR